MTGNTGHNEILVVHKAVLLFICQVASVRRQRIDLFGLRVKLTPVQI